VSVTPGNFLGASLPIWFTNVDTIAGKISIGMSRAGVPNGASGTGQLATIRLRLAKSVKVGDTLQVCITEVAATDPNGNSIILAPLCNYIVVKVVERMIEATQEFVLRQNWPNPFNPETTIEFALPKPSQVKIQIYDVLGQLVRTLVNEPMAAGVTTVKWDGRNEENRLLSTGIYLYRIEAGNFVATRKLMLMR
jgi:hypothetical protein